MRTTERELKRDVKLLQDRGHEIELVCEYGTAVVEDALTGKPLTGILTKAEMNTWLDGYNAGARSSTFHHTQALTILGEMIDAGLVNESWGELFDRVKKIVR